MANPDLHRDRGTSPRESPAFVRPPEIIDLPTSFDLAEFPSEEPVVEPPPAAAGLKACATSDATANSVSEATANAVAEAATNSVAQAFRPADTRSLEPEPEPEPEPGAVLNFASRTVPDVTPIPEAPSGPDEALTLLQVLESGEHVSWREAVAIVQQLCLQLKDVPSHAPVLIEPGAIQITSAGQLHLLSRQQGGDPLVIQLGRLLRSMVSTESIPSELRLLISQATFELAIFDSVDQFARALDGLSGPPDKTEVKTAFRKALHHTADRLEAAAVEPLILPRPPLPSLLPQPAPKPPKVKRYRERRFDASGLLPRIAAAAIVLAGAATVFMMSRDTGVTLSSQSSSSYVPSMAAPQQVTTPLSAAPTTGERGPSRALTTPVEVEPSAARSTARIVERATRPSTRASNVAAPPAAVGSESMVSLPRPTPLPPSTRESPTDLIRRAGALFSEGKASDASIVLDLVVLTAPLYEPAVGDLPPDGSAAFRASQRQLLPNIAARELDRATAALNAGDIDRALTLSGGVTTMLDRFDPDSTSPLRSKLQQLLRRADATRTAAENTVYGGGDADVTPPHPLSRQFPEGAPSGIPPARIGTLELIVGKAGDVEFVKLHTPLNRYHERMIVSAVKAWRYSPALRAGKPVRFRLTISVNLPEAGNGTS